MHTNVVGEGRPGGDVDGEPRSAAVPSTAGLGTKASPKICKFFTRACVRNDTCIAMTPAEALPHH